MPFESVVQTVTGTGYVSELLRVEMLVHHGMNGGWSYD
jgi:hypothetical protein